METSKIANTGKMPEISSINAAMKAVASVNTADDFDLQHHFSKGIYTRVLTIPEKHIVIGKMHRHKTLNILMSGEILIYTGANQQPKRMIGPYVFESEPMCQKIGIAVTETVWANVHVTEKTDLAEIENEFIVPYDEYLPHEVTEIINQLEGEL